MAKLLIVSALYAISASAAEPATLNGSWVLDEDRSQNLDDASRELNAKINAERRERKANKPDREPRKQGSNRFQNQADATAEMIREDSRSIDWGGPDASRRILESSAIRLYKARKVVILYDGQYKRTLTINPSGRAYSVSGMEITNDPFGRSLTFIDGDAIVIETQVDSAVKLIERYELDGEQTDMIQAFSMQVSPAGPALEFERTFVRAK